MKQTTETNLTGYDSQLAGGRAVDCVQAQCRVRGPFLESPENFSGTKSYS